MMSMKEIEAEIEKMSLSQKIDFVIYTRRRFTSRGMYNYDGFWEKRTSFCAHFSLGDSYVYCWKHVDGDVFYVGSGRNLRMTTKSGRNDDFFKEIDKGDAIVYLIADGLDPNAALHYEHYISNSFTNAGIKLANKDVSFTPGRDDYSLEMTRKIEDALLRILQDDKFDYSLHFKIKNFLQEYGDNYFSSKR